jgi:hypothetical protein
MALIPPVAEQPTFIGKLQALWDFTSVKLAVLAGLLGAIGLGIPAGQQIFGADFMSWVPAWFVHTCQVCGLLVTLGIVPARGTSQPDLPAKQAQRAAANTGQADP